MPENDAGSTNGSPPPPLAPPLKIGINPNGAQVNLSEAAAGTLTHAEMPAPRLEMEILVQEKDELGRTRRQQQKKEFEIRKYWQALGLIPEHWGGDTRKAIVDPRRPPIENVALAEMVRELQKQTWCDEAMMMCQKVLKDETAPSKMRLDAARHMALLMAAAKESSNRIMKLAEKASPPKQSAKQHRNLPPVAVQVNVGNNGAATIHPADSGRGQEHSPE